VYSPSTTQQRNWRKAPRTPRRGVPPRPTYNVEQDSSYACRPGESLRCLRLLECNALLWQDALTWDATAVPGCVGLCGQHRCSGCGTQLSANDRHKQCKPCRTKLFPLKENLPPTISTEQQITHNAAVLFHSLPKHSHHRAPLLHALSQGLSSAAAAKALHSSSSYVRACKRKSVEKADLLHDSYGRRVKRQRTEPARQQHICEFIATACPVKSGSRSITYYQYTTDDSLYAAYRQSTSTPLSFHTFYNIKRWMHVRRAGKYFGQFDCSRCITFQKLQHIPEGELTVEQANDMRGCKIHRNVRTIQQTAYQSTRFSLKKRQLLVVMDFTSALLTPKMGHTQSHAVVQDCIVVLEYLSPSGARVRENLDFLCDCSVTNKNDYHFVLQVWLVLFSIKRLLVHFDCIDIWSDGGPHHFKTRFCQWMWSWLSVHRFASRRISHHFFASYHGHSLADAHAASVKRTIHTQYNYSTLQRICTDITDLYWGPEDAVELSGLLQRNSNTQPCVFPHIDRDPSLKPNPTPVPSIKRQHRFDYENGKCYARELSIGRLKKLFSFKLRPCPKPQPTRK
jgi:hypothetical protein